MYTLFHESKTSKLISHWKILIGSEDFKFRSLENTSNQKSITVTIYEICCTLTYITIKFKAKYYLYIPFHESKIPKLI